MLPSIHVILIAYLFVIPVYLVGRFWWLHHTQGFLVTKERGQAREVGLLFFFLYLVMLAFATLWGDWDRYGSLGELFDYAGWRINTDFGINLTPFVTIKRYYRYRTINNRLFLSNVLGNCVLFFPFGFGLYVLGKHRYRAVWITVLSLVIPCMIEGLQLFIGRQVDVDDVLLNFLGSLLGLAVGALISHFFHKLNTNP